MFSYELIVTDFSLMNFALWNISMCNSKSNETIDSYNFKKNISNAKSIYCLYQIYIQKYFELKRLLILLLSSFHSRIAVCLCKTYHHMNVSSGFSQFWSRRIQLRYPGLYFICRVHYIISQYVLIYNKYIFICSKLTL